MKMFFINKKKLVLYGLPLFILIAIKIFMLQLCGGMESKLLRQQARLNSIDNKLRLLEAEWTYLSNPDRTRRLTDRLLPNRQITNSIQIVQEDKEN